MSNDSETMEAFKVSYSIFYLERSVFIMAMVDSSLLTEQKPIFV
jgi:hypothetical protein